MTVSKGDTYICIQCIIIVNIMLECHLRRVDALLNHLTEVMSKKDTIIGRLQNKAAENSLKIEAPFQKYATLCI